MCSLGTEGIPSLSDLGMYIVYAIHHHIHKHCKYFLFRPSVPAELSGGCSISPLPWPIAWPSHNLASEHAKGWGECGSREQHLPASKKISNQRSWLCGFTKYWPVDSDFAFVLRARTSRTVTKKLDFPVPCTKGTQSQDNLCNYLSTSKHHTLSLA